VAITLSAWQLSSIWWIWNGIGRYGPLRRGLYAGAGVCRPALLLTIPLAAHLRRWKRRCLRCAGLCPHQLARLFFYRFCLGSACLHACLLVWRGFACRVRLLPFVHCACEGRQVLLVLIRRTRSSMNAAGMQYARHFRFARDNALVCLVSSLRFNVIQ